jgi:hypothetical protein
MCVLSHPTSRVSLIALVNVGVFLKFVISFNREVLCCTSIWMCLEPYGSRFDARRVDLLYLPRRGEVDGYWLSCVLLVRSVSEYQNPVYSDSILHTGKEQRWYITFSSK